MAVECWPCARCASSDGDLFLALIYRKHAPLKQQPIRRHILYVTA